MSPITHLRILRMVHYHNLTLALGTTLPFTALALATLAKLVHTVQLTEGVTFVFVAFDFVDFLWEIVKILEKS
jgi:hypothetical protein